MHRRRFLNASGAGLAAGLLAACGGGGGADSTVAAGAASDDPLGPMALKLRPPPAGPVKSRVIVIGGGMAGATVAKYLRLWGDGIEVTLVERANSYTSNIMSSLVLTGQRNMASLGFNYNKLVGNHDVKTVFGEVLEIDPVNRRVRLASGTVLSADRIVLAPGIDFDDVPGLGSSDRMPHA